MVPYGKDSLLYVGGKHTKDVDTGKCDPNCCQLDSSSNQIYLFWGNEAR